MRMGNKENLILATAVALGGCSISSPKPPETQAPIREVDVLVDCVDGPYTGSNEIKLTDGNSAYFGARSADGNVEEIEAAYNQGRIIFHPLNTEIKFDGIALGDPIISNSGVIYTIIPESIDEKRAILNISADCPSTTPVKIPQA